MIKKYYILIRFLRFWWAAQTKYDVHSPFVFEFVEKVLENKQWYYAFSEIEPIRSRILKNKTAINVTDFGAGSHLLKDNKRKISDIAKTSLTPSDRCRLLFRLVEFWQPKTLLEFGTSLGIATLYQAAPRPKSKFITLEGCPNIATVARENFKLFGLADIDCLVGEFEQTLPQAIQQLGNLDYVFFDGNHQKEATIRYFERCLPFATENSLFVFDDIYWSEGMAEAWEKIKKNPKVRLTIDLFFFGLVFFRNEQHAVEHLKLVPAFWKPWRLGFF